MHVELIKAGIEDAEAIHAMQIAAFKPLLDVYHDYSMSPGAESLERVLARFMQPTTDYYIIKADGTRVGAIRVVRLDGGGRCRISPIFVLPEFQNKGIASLTFMRVEELYPPRDGWELDTILEETGNCHLYEKLGYVKTGRVERFHEGMHMVFYEKKENV